MRYAWVCHMYVWYLYEHVIYMEGREWLYNVWNFREYVICLCDIYMSMWYIWKDVSDYIMYEICVSMSYVCVIFIWACDIYGRTCVVILCMRYVWVCHMYMWYLYEHVIYICISNAAPNSTFVRLWIDHYAEAYDSAIWLDICMCT